MLPSFIVGKPFDRENASIVKGWPWRVAAWPRRARSVVLRFCESSPPDSTVSAIVFEGGVFTGQFAMGRPKEHGVRQWWHEPCIG